MLKALNPKFLSIMCDTQLPVVWNTLPAAIQNITCNPQTFKKEIEKKLVNTHALYPIQSDLENL